jgi:2-amino-4-hydroxy-6-hydroxymethyldihydropteridine diphosphokinase
MSGATANVAYVALGSNLGSPPENLLRAMDRLQQLSDQPIVRSSIYETDPVDCPPDSPRFANAVVALVPRRGETPEGLLGKLQAIEREFGRRPKQVHNEPRPLDLDLIAFGNERRATPSLVVPHSRAHERRFVLEPLAEIAPDLVLPGQAATVSELLKALL